MLYEDRKTNLAVEDRLNILIKEQNPCKIEVKDGTAF